MKTKDQAYDAIVIGAGQAGGPLSTTLARAGWRTALVEREHVGGTCVNEGCTPTKTMVASARVAHLVKRAADYGVKTGRVSVDLRKVRERKRAIVESFRGGSQRGIERTEGVDLLMGEASFVAEKTVRVKLNAGDEVELTGKKIFINTGTRPRQPEVAGIEQVPVLTSTSIMELDRVPEHLLVLGGGYIGLEFGQMFRRFGSEVTIVQRRDQLLVREDPDVAEEVAKILREDGVQVLLQTTPIRVAQKDGTIYLTVRDQDGERTIDGSHLLVAAGRMPNSDMLNLEAAGVETDGRGFIKVNERLETTAADVYALGDVKGGPAFTH
ncbi:MAG: FAD-containing oxidoreductase, partial [Calditrichaeota bacterium]